MYTKELPNVYTEMATMKRLTVREFRANMGKLTKASDPIVLGDKWHHYALVVPLPRAVTYAHQIHRHELPKAQARANAVFRELRKLHR